MTVEVLADSSVGIEQLTEALGDDSEAARRATIETAMDVKEMEIMNDGR